MLRRLAAPLIALALLPAAAAADPGGISQLGGDAGCLSTTALADCASVRGLDGAAEIDLSPGSEHAYVASEQGVTVFSRDAVNGVLTQVAGDAGCLSSTGAPGCSVARGLPDASTVAVSPDGAYVYVGSYQPRGLAVFSRDATTGALTQLPGTAGCFAEEAGCDEDIAFGLVDIAVSPDSVDVYVAALLSARVEGFRRAGDGSLSHIPAPGGCLVKPDGFLDPGGCQQPRAFSSPQSLEFAPGGQLLVAGGQNSFDDANAVTVYDRDPGTGALAQPGGAVGCLVDDLYAEYGPDCGMGFFLNLPTAIAIAPDGAAIHVAYGSGAFDGQGAAGYGPMTAVRDPSSGLLTEQRPGSGVGDPPYDKVVALAVSPDGRNLYGARLRFNSDSSDSGNGITAWARSGYLYKVQGATGCVSETGTFGECADGRGLASARDLVISGDGRFLYAAASNPGAITVFAREAPGPFNDVDRDGVADTDDTCPTEAGPAAGCPDGDGDGVADSDDFCLEEKGPAPEGCPVFGPNVTPPGGKVTVKRKAKLRKVLRKGLLRFRYSCEESSKVSASLKLPRKQAKKLKVKRAIAGKASTMCAGGKKARGLAVFLRSKAVKRLARARKVTPTLTLRFRGFNGIAASVAVKLTWKR